MHPKLASLRSAATAAWTSAPGSRPKVWGIWAAGLALGAALFAAALLLPPYTAALLWLALLGLGLLLALRAEPVLEGVSPHAKAQRKTQPPRPPALLDMAPVGGGLFRMGSPPATEEEIREYAVQWAEVLHGKPNEQEERVKGWRQREEPAHPIRLSPFSIARTPVTRGQWRAVMPDAPEEWEQDSADATLPATHVDWRQALAFCNALSRREGLSPCYRNVEEDNWRWERAADGYRLPTEAEWEYACRADTTGRWFWGDRSDGADRHAWYSGNAEGRVHPVGEKAANRWKLFDMAGLVLEWCWDRYGEYPKDTDPPPTDPAGPEGGDSRVVRGGSFALPPFFLRSALRVFFGPDVRNARLGLRCVRSRVRQP